MANPSSRTSEAIGGAIDAVADALAAGVGLIGNLFAHLERLAADATRDAQAVTREATSLWDALAARLEEIARAVRGAPRFARVAGELLRIVAAYRWHATVRVPFAAVFRESPETEALHQRSAERLYALCVELRGGVLKLGQFASSRMDLLPDAYVAALGRLQDRVPPAPARAIVRRLARELGPDSADRFRSFDPQPLAAASLAQVHAATLADGTPVAVKVQLPGIERLVETDLAALQMVAPALRDLLPFLDVETFAVELSRAVRGELDYRAEAVHAAAFAALFAGDPDVVVPRVHGEHSTQRVLVLERLAGMRLTDYLDACEARGAAGASDRDRVFAILVRCFCAQVLEHGLLHADPHPGNFLVLDGTAGPRLALLDFGCVQRFPAERRRAYARLCLAVLAGDPAQLADLFAAMGFATRDGDAAALGAFADLLLAAFRADSDQPLAALDPPAAMRRILHLTRDNPIVAVPPDFVLLGRVFATLGGLLLRYRPQVNLFQILTPYVLSAAREDT
jgi:predicted unusual protein kinase regulating ubiquinone biosynthesis (AarF/ABC1/UbiB family)